MNNIGESHIKRTLWVVMRRDINSHAFDFFDHNRSYECIDIFLIDLKNPNKISRYPKMDKNCILSSRNSTKVHIAIAARPFLELIVVNFFFFFNLIFPRLLTRNTFTPRFLSSKTEKGLITVHYHLLQCRMPVIL